MRRAHYPYLDKIICRLNGQLSNLEMSMIMRWKFETIHGMEFNQRCPIFPVTRTRVHLVFMALLRKFAGRTNAATFARIYMASDVEKSPASSTNRQDHHRSISKPSRRRLVVLFRSLPSLPFPSPKSCALVRVSSWMYNARVISI